MVKRKELTWEQQIQRWIENKKWDEISCIDDPDAIPALLDAFAVDITINDTEHARDFLESLTMMEIPEESKKKFVQILKRLYFLNLYPGEHCFVDEQLGFNIIIGADICFPQAFKLCTLLFDCIGGSDNTENGFELSYRFAKYGNATNPHSKEIVDFCCSVLENDKRYPDYGEYSSKHAACDTLSSLMEINHQILITPRVIKAVLVYSCRNSFESETDLKELAEIGWNDCRQVYFDALASDQEDLVLGALWVFAGRIAEDKNIIPAIKALKISHSSKIQEKILDIIDQADKRKTT
jgi:hypothetical protein